MTDKTTTEAMRELRAFRLPSIPRFVAAVVLFAIARLFFNLGHLALSAFQRVTPGPDTE